MESEISTSNETPGQIRALENVHPLILITNKFQNIIVSIYNHIVSSHISDNHVTHSLSALLLSARAKK